MIRSNRLEIRAGQFVPGSAIKILDPVKGITQTLIAAPEGTVRSPCLHFDGKRLVFAMRRDAEENFHIFEIGMDGKTSASTRMSVWKEKSAPR